MGEHGGDTLQERKLFADARKVSTPSESQNYKVENDKLVMWRSPFLTTYYFMQEVVILLQSMLLKVYEHRRILSSIVALCIFIYILSLIKGPHQVLIQYLRGRINWSLYWMALGVLSSIGLGTGLHTFILYLGPHIASVTLAGYECGGLNFPEPPYPQQIVCPSQIDPRWVVSVWNIMWKVRLESIMWGAGTALGELPPYFMARAAKQSGSQEDDDLRELEDLQKIKDDPKALNVIDKIKLMIQHLIQKVGFFGILVCASIPNPLFDLAGIMCGHFEVPFWTFFGATLLGKAVIKMMLQKLFVIIAFSDTLIDKVLTTFSYIPVLGTALQDTVSQVLAMQKEKLYNPTDDPSGSPTTIESIYQFFVLSMIFYFVISIVNSLAQTNYKKSKKHLRGKKVAKD